MLTPIHFKKWIDENRNLLKPPVGNKVIWENREFIVMVVGGPNSRTDFHINCGEEFFYQLEGDINLRLIENGKPKDFPLREGEIFLLPPGIPHSPVRPAKTIGLVIEHKRALNEKDGLAWYCETCGKKLYEEYFYLKNIEKDFLPIFDRFFNHPEHSTCHTCGTRMTKK